MNVHLDNKTEVAEKAIKEFFISFLEKGYNKTKYSKIVNSPGFKKGSVKRIFPTKKDVFKTIFEIERLSGQSSLNSIFSNIDVNNKRSVANSLNDLFNFVGKSKFLRMIYKFDNFPLIYCFEVLGKKDGEPIIGHTTILENFLEKCQKAGTVRTDDAVLIANVLRTLVYIFLQENRLLENTNEMDKLMTKIFIDGIIL